MKTEIKRTFGIFSNSIKDLESIQLTSLRCGDKTGVLDIESDFSSLRNGMGPAKRGLCLHGLTTFQKQQHKKQKHQTQQRERKTKTLQICVTRMKDSIRQFLVTKSKLKNK